MVSSSDELYNSDDSDVVMVTLIGFNEWVVMAGYCKISHVASILFSGLGFPPFSMVRIVPSVFEN